MYSMVSCCSVRCALAKARTFDSVVASSLAKIESKNRACAAQDGSLASGVSGESAAGGMPARKRAVSLNVAVSALRAGVQASASATTAAAAATTARDVALGAVERIGAGARGIGGRDFGEHVGRIINDKARRHQCQAAERLQRPIHDKIVHHEGRQRQESERRDWIAPGTIRPCQIRMRDPHLDHAQYRKK